MTEIEGDPAVLADADDPPDHQSLVGENEHEDEKRSAHERGQRRDTDAQPAHKRERREHHVERECRADRGGDPSREAGEQAVARRENANSAFGEPQREHEEREPRGLRREEPGVRDVKWEERAEGRADGRRR